jgi:hypothetical protein
MFKLLKCVYSDYILRDVDVREGVDQDLGGDNLQRQMNSDLRFSHCDTSNQYNLTL